MCVNQTNTQAEGKQKVPNRRTAQRRNSFMTMFTIALAITVMIVLAILVIPSVTVHRIYVTIGQDQIIDVSAETDENPADFSTFSAIIESYRGLYNNRKC